MGYLIEPGKVADPDELLKSITEPAADKWFLFVIPDQGNTWKSTNERVNKLCEEAAIIVRLTGSPLVKFPLIRGNTPPQTRQVTLELAKLINAHLKEEGNHNVDLTEPPDQPERPQSDSPEAPDFDKRYLGGLHPATVLEEHHALQLSFPGLSQHAQGLPRAFTDWTPDGSWRFWACLLYTSRCV